MEGYRKLAVTVLIMLIATMLLILGSIDQEVFKWLMTSSGVTYLTTNVVAKFS